MLFNLTPLRYLRKTLLNGLPILLLPIKNWIEQLLNSYANVLERDDRAKTYTQTPPTDGSGIQGLVTMATSEQCQLRTENVTSREINPPTNPIDSGSPDLDACGLPYAYAVSPKYLPFIESPQSSIVIVTPYNTNSNIGTQYVVTIEEWIDSVDIPVLPFPFPNPNMAGKKGQKTTDVNYIYFCIDDDTWIRTLKDIGF
jgi:hypothetical protein